MQPSAFIPQPGTLYIVATPIGNLRDITLRALDVLRGVDIVAAEDTRVTQGLLAAYGIRKPLAALHEHNEARVTPKLVDALKAGRSIALVSDAGTPGISDPGAHLVRSVRAVGLPLVPIPGASAITAALSVAGLAAPKWLFHGFLPPRPKARRQVLTELAALPFHLVFFEVPHRIVESVADMAAVLGPKRELVLARELTKRFEQITHLTLGQALDWLAADPDRQRGEFALVVSGAVHGESSDEAAARKILNTLLDELPASQAARIAARLTGLKRSDLYARALSGKTAARDLG